MNEKSIRDTAIAVLRAEAEAISSLIEKLNSDFERAVEAVYASKGRTIVTGMGKSGIIAKKIAATLSSTGTPAAFLHPAEAVHGDLGMVTAEDVLIALSNSGETEEIIRITPFLKRFNVTLISMTRPDSALAQCSDIVLDVFVKEEACPLGIVPTASTTAALAMGDALAVALFIKRGFREEDFALFHPNGSLGKKLLIRVEDLMHSGKNVPVVNVATPMTDTTIEISSKRLGMTVVCDDDGKIAGIVTDGDLRRGLEKWGAGLFELTAGEVMTTNPRLIDARDLAARALSLMENHSITSLIVAGSGGSPQGIIHLHDILKKGIV
jgi:arabinose-5-phosphate isomerase